MQAELLPSGRLPLPDWVPGGMAHHLALSPREEGIIHAFGMISGLEFWESWGFLRNIATSEYTSLYSTIRRFLLDRGASWAEIQPTAIEDFWPPADLDLLVITGPTGQQTWPMVVIDNLLLCSESIKLIVAKPRPVRGYYVLPDRRHREEQWKQQASWG